MKFVALILMVGGTLLVSAFSTPSRGDDSQLDRKHVRSVEIRNVAARNGKNVSLDIAVNPPPNIKLPRGISAVVNGRQVHLYDDGRWPDERTGDGVYSVGGSTRDKQPLSDKTTLRGQSAGLPEAVAASPKVKCTLRQVECPRDCKSAIFGSKCVICLEFKDCEISFDF
jgi:hypothetical protein